MNVDTTDYLVDTAVLCAGGVHRSVVWVEIKMTKYSGSATETDVFFDGENAI